MSLRARIWTLRISILAAIVMLCAVAGSGIPSLAIAIAWSPNGLFLAAFLSGVLRFPRAFEPVHSLEPLIYQRLGVGLVKQIVANPVWPMLHGLPPPPIPKTRADFRTRIERDMKAAEICHAATFVVASCVAFYYWSTDRAPVAIWITIFNIALNAYPVMLQRTNRRRLQQSRLDARPPATADR